MAETPSTPAETSPRPPLKQGGAITWIERLGPECALGTDGQQWIVFRRHGPASAHGLSWQGQRWDATGFIHSSKRALINCLEVKGLKLSPEGRAAIKRQDAKIWRWRRASDA